MTRPLTVALAGLGTVGGGVLKLLRDNADIVTARAGRPIAVTAVSARDRLKDRGFPVTGLHWYEDPVALAADPTVDVVVELIGGSEGPARALAEATIVAGKPLVTANKALLAVHGATLARAAEERGVALGFEAAVAGGIPVIKALREGLAGNRISAVAGILNGTCNYILTQMRERGREFAEVLADAQKLGYAEADPSFDIDGIDAAHKLAILAALAFGRPVAFDQVHACMVPQTAPIARVDGVFNAVVAEGDFVGRVMLEGRGAGAGPTASAVVADLIDIARNRMTPVWGAAGSALSSAPSVPMSNHVGPYYLRLMVVDRPGVIADVTAILRDMGVSLESMLQRGRSPGEAVPVVLVTHETKESAMREALDRIAALPTVMEQPTLIRIEPG
jgi:homoserine dehydrogenase